MTQYNQNPNATQQPPMGYAPVPADPYAAQGYGGNLRMCRAAAVTQMVIGSLICLLAFCLLAGGAMIASGAVPTEGEAGLSELTSELGTSAVGIVVLIAGVCAGLPGLAQVILGFFVWRGSTGCIIASIVVNALFGALMLLNLGALLSREEAGNALGMCMNVLLLAIMTGLIVLLVRAYRETKAAAAWAAYAVQWQQYQYQMALYQQQQAAQAGQVPAGPAQPPEPVSPPLPPPAVSPAPPAHPAHPAPGIPGEPESGGNSPAAQEPASPAQPSQPAQPARPEPPLPPPAPQEPRDGPGGGNPPVV